MLLLLPVCSFAAAEKVSFRTPEGATLNAIYSKPSADKPTVIMHHGLASVKEEWQPLIELLVKRGDGVLAYDARPAGTPWQKLVDDMGAAIRFLEGKGIKRETVALAGASLGANVCLKYASLTKNGRNIILLSPGMNYQGLDVENVVPTIAVPMLFIAHPADGYAYQSCNRLVPSAKKARLLVSTKPGHGVQMFDEALLDRITQWLEKPQ